MKVALIPIGNSRGIRIPKPIIEECGFGDTVELSIEAARVIIAPHRPARQGWEEAFRAAGPAENDEVALGTLPNEFDHEDWRW